MGNNNICNHSKEKELSNDNEFMNKYVPSALYLYDSMYENRLQVRSIIAYSRWYDDLFYYLNQQEKEWKIYPQRLSKALNSEKLESQTKVVYRPYLLAKDSTSSDFYYYYYQQSSYYQAKVYPVDSNRSLKSYATCETLLQAEQKYKNYPVVCELKVDLLQYFFYNNSNNIFCGNYSRIMSYKSKKSNNNYNKKSRTTDSENGSKLAGHKLSQRQHHTEAERQMLRFIKKDIVQYDHLIRALASAFDKTFMELYSSESSSYQLKKNENATGTYALDQRENDMVYDCVKFISVIEYFCKSLYQYLNDSTSSTQHTYIEENSFFYAIAVQNFCRYHYDVTRVVLEVICENNADIKERLWNNMRSLQNVMPRQLGLSENICEYETKQYSSDSKRQTYHLPFEKAIYYFEHLHDIKNPLRILENQLKLKNLICQCVSEYNSNSILKKGNFKSTTEDSDSVASPHAKSSNNYKQYSVIVQPKVVQIDADQLIQIYSYILIRSQMSEIYDLLDFVEALTEKRIEESDEEAYCFMMLRSAVNYVLNLDGYYIYNILAK